MKTNVKNHLKNLYICMFCGREELNAVRHSEECRIRIEAEMLQNGAGIRVERAREKLKRGVRKEPPAKCGEGGAV